VFHACYFIASTIYWPAAFRSLKAVKALDLVLNENESPSHEKYGIDLFNSSVQAMGFLVNKISSACRWPCSSKWYRLILSSAD